MMSCVTSVHSSARMENAQDRRGAVTARMTAGTGATRLDAVGFASSLFKL